MDLAAKKATMGKIGKMIPFLAAKCMLYYFWSTYMYLQIWIIHRKFEIKGLNKTPAKSRIMAAIYY